MHWCPFGARTSATIMMTFAGQCISQIQGITVKRQTASKKEPDGLLVGFANIEFEKCDIRESYDFQLQISLTLLHIAQLSSTGRKMASLVWFTTCSAI